MPKGVYPRKPKTHCKNGHKMTVANTHVSPAGNRRCRICLAKQARKRRRSNPQIRAYQQQLDARRAEKKARQRFVRLYGLTPEQIAALAEQQQNRCACCGTPGELQKLHAGRAAPPGRLVVDHCHETNTVRGLLCDRCNKVLGHVKDDADLLWQLASYVDRSRLPRAA